ncbi:M15 family metallopeptidase [Cellulophaga sp. E16_2]|uniref:Peptidase M15B and M15C DD-carboxypeptidase VanY/endolysin n=1 Tax=Cellulophaga algicola (strain DSM 14237 / IC166 / ACAM 630) TaxID=688270 RepID=E6X6M9_CELAD|nr:MULTISPECIES: M15 family metallopeptidase [Cellulophaga]ADV49567.1 peptidase M15B and M15C DD-carboxypeptidase VanY/endolysin [Cellulophaga algicola DSM 14237]MBO0592016.1 M15 family metallopeptidase [Cellulophaga sp. E16_2]
MQRRSFIKKTTVSGIALALVPSITLAQDKDVEYSILELMGKTRIELFGKGINLRKEAHDAFIEMKRAAYTGGIDLKIVSSYRSFDRQQVIFENKFIKYTDAGMAPLAAISKIIEYSTIPGTSRHHWGTDIDVIDGYQKVSGDVLVPSKYGEGQPFADFKKWMDENAEKFGFYLVYTDDKKRRGFKYEPWHYSYAPISIPMLETLRGKNLLQIYKDEDFIGSEHFTSGFLRTYITDNILDINPKLL